MAANERDPVAAAASRQPGDDLVRPAWGERRFTFGAPPWMLADFAERLRGTAPRLAALLATIPAAILDRQHQGRWSILQNAGHLADVEELWELRIEDLKAARPTFTPARPEHFRALAERHQTRSAIEIVEELRARRARLVAALLEAPPELQRRSAHHERLQCDMRLVDCAQFVTEHDDHHLLRIRAIAAELGEASDRPPTTPASPARDAVISLREVTKETVRQIVQLEVAPAQRRFVATNGMSIAEAHFSPDSAWFRAVYADETPVGFVMLEDEPEKQQYYLWRFMMDARFQRLGLGRRALEAVISHVRTRPGATQLLLSCVPGEGSPCPFYERMGFVYTGAEEHGELVMRLDL